MSESEIDWNSELRKLEREFDGLPPEPTPEDLRAYRAAQLHRYDRTTSAGVWARLALVAALAAGLAFWPYARACGSGLFGYIATAAMVVAGGVWVTTWTWRARMALAHALALVIVLCGLAVIGGELLPRIGYARTDPLNPPQWWCGR